MLITVSAFSVDGSPLPEGFTFDERRNLLTAAPASLHGDIEVLFVARDGLGGEARMNVRLRSEDVPGQ